MTLIQGIIDVFWIEEDGIVLLDYKTDFVTEPKELVLRYEEQLNLYADALNRVHVIAYFKRGRTVSNCHISAILGNVFGIYSGGSGRAD